MIKLERPPCPNPDALRTNYKHSDNKAALRNSAHDKCMYCESKISHNHYAHVEHYKPKVSFPDLEFEWTNLGYACSRCNTNKLDKFNNALPYINPYSEMPSDTVFFYGALLFSKNGGERGELTIKDINLNSAELVEKRGDKIKDIDKAIKAAYRTNDIQLRTDAIVQLREEGDSSKEYSLCVNTFLDVAQEN